MVKCDIIIIGSGIAALSTADKLCKSGRKVNIITKSLKKSSNSSLAQGGISVALSEMDNYKFHYDDTMEAGCYLNNSEAVMKLVSKAPEVINDFINEGMKFDKNEDGNLDFSKEGAHHISRILHAGGDRTGLKVIEKLFENVNENVVISENEMVIDLRVHNGECIGVITRKNTGNITYYEANDVVIAAGGIGQLYTCTSNDITITGDAIAMAYRAGCKLKNLEFVQFHPTMLNIGGGKTSGLISEAVRGEGGIIVNEKNERIMENEHPLKDLAPRDIVSRTVYSHFLEGEKIYLDISNVKDFKKRFPSVTEICESSKIDLSKNIIPIIPGAHFHMGGIEALPDGTTNIKRLYAVGECACTGVHGANRLASNSLLEGLVFGKFLAENILNNNNEYVKSHEIYKDEISEVKIKKLPSKEEIQNKMMEFVGIVRYKDKIEKILNWFENYMPSNEGFVKINIENTTNEQIEIYNMLTAGYLITKAALKRDESIGAHFII